MGLKRGVRRSATGRLSCAAHAAEPLITTLSEERKEPQLPGTVQAEDRRPAPSAGEPAQSKILQQRHEEQVRVLRRAREGDQEAFRWLMETHQNRVFGIIIRSLGCDRHAAADICQEVFMRAFRSLDSFDGRALFGTWLHKITMNLCISEYRRRRAMKRDRPTISIDAPSAGHEDYRLDPESREHDPAERMHHKSIKEAVAAALPRLPEDYRHCVLLRDMQGMSYEEIAEILDIPKGTVRSRIHRGRVILQQLLKEFSP